MNIDSGELMQIKFAKQAHNLEEAMAKILTPWMYATS